MPLWARFVVASLSGGGLGLALTLAAALWRVGPPQDWAAIWRFLQGDAIGRLFLLFWAIHAGVLLAGRLRAVLSGLIPLRGAVAIAGAVAALAYAGVLAGRTGLPPVIVIPDAALLGAVFALTGLFSVWLEQSL